jgi:F-type H+-transporting ATPase subunit b
MTPRYRIALILIAIPLLLFMFSEEEHHPANSMDFVWKVANFLVLFGGLTFLLHKPIKKFLADRAVAIDRSLKEAKDSRRGAERTLEEGRKRLTQLSREISQMDEEASVVGEKEKAQILKEAQEDAVRIKEQAQLEIDMLSRLGVKELKEYAVSLAAEQALERIRKRITDQVHVDLIDKSIERLEKLHEKASFG